MTESTTRNDAGWPSREEMDAARERLPIRYVDAVPVHDALELTWFTRRRSASPPSSPRWPTARALLRQAIAHLGV
jgi:hypothetical protein